MLKGEPGVRIRKYLEHLPHRRSLRVASASRHGRGGHDGDGGGQNDGVARRQARGRCTAAGLNSSPAGRLVGQDVYWRGEVSDLSRL